MSDCPGYLSIIINDRTAAEQLFHYDVMLPCPSRFNLTFKVPRSMSSRPSQPPRSVQTFEVALDDVKRVYRLLLTYFWSVGTAGDDGIAEAAEAYSSKVIEGQTADVTKVVTACVMVVAVCLSVRLLCDVAVLRREKPGINHSDPDDVIQPYISEPVSSTADRPQRRHLVFLWIYVGFNVVYSLLVTFTAISAVFLFYFRSEIDHVTTDRRWLGELTRRAISDVEAVSARNLEIELELAQTKLRQVPTACTRYIDDVSDVVRQSIANVTSRRRKNSTSVSGLMATVINSTLADAERRLLKYVDELDRQFQRRAHLVSVHRGRFRGRVIDSVWLLYARSLFNRSTASSTSTSSSAVSQDDVMRFLEEMMSVHHADQRGWYKPARLQRSVTVILCRCRKTKIGLMCADVDSL